MPEEYWAMMICMIGATWILSRRFGWSGLLIAHVTVLFSVLCLAESLGGYEGGLHIPFLAGWILVVTITSNCALLPIGLTAVYCWQHYHRASPNYELFKTYREMRRDERMSHRQFDRKLDTKLNESGERT